MRRRSIAVLLSGAVVAVGWGEISRAQEVPRIVSPRVSAAPEVDGALEDAVWQSAALVATFTRPLSKQVAPGVVARVCHDGRALYIAVECHEDKPKAIRCERREGDTELWRDDCVEVWVRVGQEQTEFDQYIVNAAGAKVAVRARIGHPLTRVDVPWQAAAQIGRRAWTVEMGIPFATLGIQEPASGVLIQLKIGRERYAGGRQELWTWPPGSRYAGAEDYGLLYLDTDNLLPNPQMAEVKDGRIAHWGFGQRDAGLFSSVEDRGRRVIRFRCPGRYATAQQGLRLKPNAVYALEASVRGNAGVYIRARTARHKGEPTRPHTATFHPSRDYQHLSVRFPTGETGEALIIIGNTAGLGAGTVYIADLTVREDVRLDADGPAIPLRAGRPVTVAKVPVIDCRALRGFVVAPIDGRLHSWNWNMDEWEYGMGGAGAGVGYRYRNNDGLHITLADDKGVDAVQIRRGAKVKLYRDVRRYDEPTTGRLVCEFAGRGRTSRTLFRERVRSRKFSFFDLQDGLIANVVFLRVEEGDRCPSVRRKPLVVTGSGSADELKAFIADRFGGATTIYRLSTGEPVQLRLERRRQVHLVSEPIGQELSLSGVAVEMDATGVPTGCPLTLAVQDPLNPRQELMGVDFTVQEPGRVRVVLDFPDQVAFARRRLWMTVTAGAPATITNVRVELYQIPRERAVGEALTFRKLIMKGLFCILSEARQWGHIRKGTDLEKFYRENHWGEGVRDLAETIAQCKALGPDDDFVRVYDEWFWRSARELAPFEPRLDKVPGAPQWAVLARQAWLTARQVPEWWLDHRLVPTGEFGGLVNDDTDMYQNYADFPMFEDAGVGARVKEAAARLAELAEAENLEQGLNKHTMDPLHAYEEGLNHEALLLWWFYGDPVYFERCLRTAKSMQALTVMTPRGHRHFKSQQCGAEDLRIDRPVGKGGDAHPLMLHPCFEVAWYNGCPAVVRFLQEWADGWLEHMQPERWATMVEVKTEKVVAARSRPLDGGYGGQASAHNFLYWITGELKYIDPFMYYFKRGRDNWPARRFVPELWQRGALDGLPEEKRRSVLGGNPITKAIALGDKTALCDALKRDIAELQRFMPMYTNAEVFTDRVFLYAITNAAICYTGGFATRNKYNHTHAASWEGFGTEYAALVLRARPDYFKALVYNFRSTEARGRLRLWTLQHGVYRLSVGPDRDGDDRMDRPRRTEEVEVARASSVALRLPPKLVTVVELRQLKKLDDIRRRPDLAISAREVRVEGGAVTGLVHNIGSAEAPRFDVVLLDARGRVRGRRTLGPLAAPLDLEPRRVEFRFPRVGGNVRGWRVVVDPQERVAEIYEGNNEVEVRGG